MTDKMNVALQIHFGANGEEVNKFVREFEAKLRGLGKTDVEIGAFADIATQVRDGSMAVEALQADVRELVQEFNTGLDVSGARDFLGLRAHADIERQVDAVKDAFKRLQDSGKLTFVEIAQANMRAQERIVELRNQTNGWAESLMRAKSSLAGLAASFAGLGYAAREAIDFESAMADVAKVVDGTDEQIDALGESLKDMAMALPVEGGAKGLAAIAAAGGQLGIPVEKLEEFTELVSKMGVAFNMNADQAGQAIAQMMNVYNLSLDQVRELADAVNVLGNTMATNEAAIVEVMTRVGGTAKQFGLSAEQASALAAAFTSLGKPAMVAGTSINALLSKLQTANVQGAEFQAALAQMGLSARQLAQDIKEKPQEALLEFLRTLQRLEGQERAELLVNLFGQEYQDDISLLVGSLGQYEAALGRVADATRTAGALEAEFAKRAETAEAQLTLLKNSVTVLAANIGQAMLPIIVGAANGLTAITQAVSAFAAENPNLAAFAATLGSVAATLAGFKLVFSTLWLVGAKTFNALRNEVILLNGALTTAKSKTEFLHMAMGKFIAIWAAWDIGQTFGKWLLQFAWVQKTVNTLIGSFHILGVAAAGAWKIIRNPFNAKAALRETQQAIDEIRQNVAELNAAADKAAEKAAEKARHPEAAAAGTQKPQSEALALTTRLNGAREAVKALGGDVSRFSGVVSEEFGKVTANLDTLIAGMQDMRAAGVDAAAVLADAFGKAIEAAETEAEINQVIARINALAAAGALGAGETGRLFDVAGLKLASLNIAMQRASAAAQTLGVDLEAAGTQLSDSFLEADRAIDVLAASFTDLKDRGYDTGQVLEDAIKKALDKTKNPADLEALIEKVVKLGEEGRFAKPKLVELFEAIKGKAKEAGGEAETLRKEIDELQRQAEAARRGRSGQGAKIAALERGGMSAEEQEREAVRTAQEAAREARLYTSAAATAQMDGRADAALKYAQQAKEAFEEADEAAGRIQDKAAQKRVREDLSGVEDGMREAERLEKQARLAEIERTKAAQEEQLSALETRIDGLVERAQSGAALQIDASGAVTAVEDVRSRLDAIPDNTEKTLTLNTVYKGDAPPTGGDASAAAQSFAVGGWTGDVAPGKIAGLVHGREFVARAGVVAQPGARRFLELFNRIGMAALPAWLKGLKLPGYRTGGYVTPQGATSSAEEMIPAIFNFPGVGKIPAQLTPSVAEELARTLKIEALMRGRR